MQRGRPPAALALQMSWFDAFLAYGCKTRPPTPESAPEGTGTMRRRDFTLGAGATLAASGLATRLDAAPALPGGAAPRTNFDPKAWHQRLKRIMQVNFNE